MNIADTVKKAARAEVYPEETVPRGGLIQAAGVDVQHNRLAVVIRAGGEMRNPAWCGEIVGSPLIKTDPVWDELDTVLRCAP